MLRLKVGALLLACLAGAVAPAQEAPPLQGGQPSLATRVLGSDDHDAAVRQLLEKTGASVNGGRLIEQLFDTFKKGLPMVPPAVWDELRAQLATEEFVDLQVAMYEKHFSLDEIRGLLAFYQSPVGKRYLEEAPGLMRDGLAMGQEFSRRAQDKLQRCLQQKGYSVG